MVERLKTIVLIILVGLSLFLSTQLWLSNPFAQPARQIRAAYVSPSSEILTDWRALVEPSQIYIHTTQGSFQSTNSRQIRLAWQAIAGAAAAVDPAELVPAETSYIAALRSAQSGLGGIEVPLAAVSSRSFWWRVWHNLPTESLVPLPGVATGPKLERVGLFLTEPDELVLVIQAEGSHSHHRLNLANLPHLAAPRWAAQQVQQLATMNEDTDLAKLQPLEDLLPTTGRLTAREGLSVAQNPTPYPALATLHTDAPDLQQLEQVFFGSSSATRTVSGRDVIIRSDGRASLAIHGKPVQWVEYQRAVGSDGRGQPVPDVEQFDELATLDAVVAFVNDAGGWPANTYLSRLEPLRERGSVQLGAEPPVTGYRLEFSLRAAGLPTSMPPIIVVEWGPSGLTLYRRQFISAEPWHHLPADGQRQADDSLAIVAALGEGVLPSDVRHVREIDLSFLAPPDQDPQEYFAFLSWRLTLQDNWQLWVDATGVRPRVWVAHPTGEVQTHWLEDEEKDDVDSQPDPLSALPDWLMAPAHDLES